MKAYLIDPEYREVTEVDVEEKEDGDMDFQHAYKLMHCETIQAVKPISSGSDMLFLDENGKFKANKYWKCRLYPYDILAGRALWVGVSGEWTRPPKMLIEYVETSIVWLHDL